MKGSNARERLLQRGAEGRLSGCRAPVRVQVLGVVPAPLEDPVWVGDSRENSPGTLQCPILRRLQPGRAREGPEHRSVWCPQGGGCF